MKRIIYVAGFMMIAFFFAQCKNEKKPNDSIEKASAQESNSTSEVAKANESNNNDSAPKAIAKPKEINAIEKSDSGTYTFQYKLSVGETYPMTITTSNTSTLTDGKQSLKETSKLVQKRNFKVLSRKGENYLIEVKDISRRESISANGEKLSYNTAGKRPTKKELATNYDVIRIEEQNPLTIEMTPKGEILSVKGLSKLQQKVIAKLEPNFRKMLKELPQVEGKPSDAEAIKNFKEGIKSSYSERAKIADLEQNLNVLPKKELKIGEGWTDKDSKKEGNNSISYNTTYTLENVDNNLASFTIKGSSKAKGSQSKNGLSVFTNSNQNTNGKIDFDQKTGWVKKANFNQKTTTKETRQFQGQKINGTRTLNTTITVN